MVGSSQKANVANFSEQNPVRIPAERGPASFDRRGEAYRIYSVILNRKWEKGNIVARDKTDGGLFQNEQRLEMNVGKSYPDAVDDYKTANKNSEQMENRFEYNGNISLIGEDEVKNTINSTEGWDAFKKSHPGASGIVTFSAVGFDLDGNHAIVNVSYLCASHCGNGTVFVLEKKDGDWTIKQEIGTWMS